MRTLRDGILGLALASTAVVVTLHCDDDDERPRVAPECVYHGNPDAWSNGAVVDPDEVFPHIPEYQKIVDEGLQPGSVPYEILMAKASRAFLEAVRRSAKSGGYDLVAKKGSIADGDSIPDVTQDVVERL